MENPVCIYSLLDPGHFQCLMISQLELCSELMYLITELVWQNTRSENCSHKRNQSYVYHAYFRSNNNIRHVLVVGNQLKLLLKYSTFSKFKGTENEVIFGTFSAESLETTAALGHVWYRGNYWYFQMETGFN